VDALGIDVWGHRVWTAPPASQGYLTLASAAIAEMAGFTPGVTPAPEDPSWPHLLVEAAKQAGQDRPDVLHDGADGPSLLAPGRLRAAAGRIRAEEAQAVGAPSGDGDTIHLAVVDQHGVGVSLIQSNAAGFGANVIVDPPGIFLHNRGIGFSLQPGHPAELRPGRKPPHTLSPALVTRPDGGLRHVLGTMGGDSQPQILLQLLARTLLHREEPSTAIAAGRWILRGGEGAGGFDTWTAGDHLQVAIEGHAPSAWSDGLFRRGHKVDRRAPFDHLAGHAHLITVEGDHLAGASDPRSGAGAAIGW
jgi:gamma-glutamyltranspeptidase/glutathione hydrolase